ncbi:hypothetical protein [Archangium lansingense]|uniref:Uncharacterized protein n=1 Tax=Archangium lansingense TaxID=2995310 RepID=A0ABT4APU8_9BACT|nr:hypothetical protein [Archangium lansinium]MCY1082869.1 hypothetical protein [Archangium lansinium]
MRILLFLVALLSGGYAGYLATAAKTSYASYSPAQLDQIEAEQSRLVNKTSGDERDQHLISLMLLREERGRPFKLQVAGGVAGLSLLSALVLTIVSGRRKDSQQEEDPYAPPTESGGARQLDRNRAAALLGVRPDAPRGVIEAALQAQLAEKDPSQLAGHDPSLRQRLLQQREELLAASHLLLGRREISFSPDENQG